MIDMMDNDELIKNGDSEIANEIEALVSLYPGRVQVIKTTEQLADAENKPSTSANSDLCGDSKNGTIVCKISVPPAFACASNGIQVEASFSTDSVNEELNGETPSTSDVGQDNGAIRPQFTRSISDKIWKDNEGMPILMLWVDWIENNTLTYLGIKQSLYLTTDIENLSSEEQDLRAVPESFSVDEKVYSIIKFESEEQKRQFLEDVHECEICFDAKKGDEFYVVPHCGHIFCLECLGEYCETHVTEGTVLALKYEVYRRWETLTFQKALDTMQDVDWCPRCEIPTVTEPDHQTSHLARCANCYFSFCTMCREAFHQGTSCHTLEDKLKLIETKSSEVSKNDEKLKLERYKEELMNAVTVRKISKPCPTCFIAIQKTGGCNKMTCGSCGSFMCWECGVAISGYDHFNSGKCKLTFGEDNDFGGRGHFQVQEPNMAFLEMQVHLENDPNLRRKLVKCPHCKQQNLKRDMNNHLKCWACRSHFCYLCKNRIPGTSHFRQKHCRQHTED